LDGGDEQLRESKIEYIVLLFLVLELYMSVNLDEIVYQKPYVISQLGLPMSNKHILIYECYAIGMRGDSNISAKVSWSLGLSNVALVAWVCFYYQVRIFVSLIIFLSCK